MENGASRLGAAEGALDGGVVAVLHAAGDGVPAVGHRGQERLRGFGPLGRAAGRHLRFDLHSILSDNGGEFVEAVAVDGVEHALCERPCASHGVPPRGVFAPVGEASRRGDGGTWGESPKFAGWVGRVGYAGITRSCCIANSVAAAQLRTPALS